MILYQSGCIAKRELMRIITGNIKEAKYFITDFINIIDHIKFWYQVS